MGPLGRKLIMSKLDILDKKKSPRITDCLLFKQTTKGMFDFFSFAVILQKWGFYWS